MVTLVASVGRPWVPGLLVLGLVAGVLANPPRASAQDDFEIWTAVLSTGAIEPSAPSLTFWLDLHARRSDPGTVGIVRPAIGYQILDWLTVWGGYAWVPVARDAPGDVIHEHRAWQQVTLGFRFEPRMVFQSRTRFEQRFSDAGDDVGFRLRQFFRFNWQPGEEVPVGLALWDELFLGFNDTDWGAVAGVDQNRLFLGPFIQLTPWARFEVGYLFLYLVRDPEPRPVHVLAMNLFLAFR